jgi:DNA-binding SARP family transcriptional activator
MASVLTFGLLGPVEACVDGVTVPLGGPRSRAVLAALLLDANRVVPVEAIAVAAWGGEAPDTARLQSQNRMSALRRALRAAGGRDVISTVGAGYVVHVGPDELDAHRFDAGLSEAHRRIADGQLSTAADALSAALRLWRGPALYGLDTPRLLAAAQRFDEARLGARELLADLNLARGRHHEVIGELLDLVTAYPWRERCVARLMVALYRAGRRREALDAFDRTSRLLVTELGVGPGQDLIRVRDQVLRDDPRLDGEPIASIVDGRHAAALTAASMASPVAQSSSSPP